MPLTDWGLSLRVSSIPTWFAAIWLPMAAMSVALAEEPAAPNKRLDEAAEARQQALTLMEQENVRAALPLVEKAWTIRSAVLGAKHIDVAQSQDELGLAQHKLGELRAARGNLERALAIRKELLGERHADTAASMAHLGWLLHDQKDFAESRTLLEQSLRIRRELLGEKHLDTADSLQKLGQLTMDQGSPIGALGYFKRALAVRQELLGDNDRITGSAHCSLGIALSGLGDFRGARQQFERALAIYKQVLGEKHTEVATTLSWLGAARVAANELLPARPILEEALAIRREALGDKSMLTATSRLQLALLLRRIGDFASAQTLLEDSLACVRELKGDEDPDTLMLTQQVAVNLFDQRKFTTALPYYERCVQLAKKMRGPEDLVTADALANLGQLQFLLGKLAEGKAAFLEALEIRKAKLGEGHETTITTLGALALTLQQAGDYNGAKDGAEQALALARRWLGDKHQITSDCLAGLAMVFSRKREFDKAQPLLEEGLAIRRAKFGDNHLEVATYLLLFGDLQRERSDAAAARRSYEEALAIRRKLLGPRHLDTLFVLEKVGHTCGDTGDRRTARKCYEEVLAGRLKLLGENHADTATALCNLAEVFESTAEFSEARPREEKALEIRRKILGDKHPDTATSLFRVGQLLLLSGGDRRQAKTLLEQAVAIREQVLGAKHPDSVEARLALAYASGFGGDLPQGVKQLQELLTRQRPSAGHAEDDPMVLAGIGTMLCQQGDYAAARSNFEQAVAAARKKWGDQHRNTQTLFVLLGRVLQHEGDYEGARLQYQRALADGLPRMNPVYDVFLGNCLAILEAQTGHWAAAAQRADETCQALCRHIARVLPGLDEKEQLTFLAAYYEPAWQASLSQVLAQPAEERLINLSAAWVVNGKAVAQEASTRRIRWAREATTPEASALLDRLFAVRRHLSNLSQQTPGAQDSAARQEQMNRAQEDERQLTRRLGEIGLNAELGEPWIALDDLRKAVPSASVLIEIVRINKFDFMSQGDKTPNGPPHYVAWAIPAMGRGAVAVVDLGLTEPLDQAIRQCRQALNTGEPAPALRKLSDLVYRPLAEYLAASGQWLISPDSSLWLIPWQMLLVENDQYAIERHTITYLVSGRELVRGKLAKTPHQDGLVLADPDFDAQSKTAAPVTSLTLRGNNQARDDALLRHWDRLPGTALEARQSAPQIERYLHQPPRLLLGTEASKAAVQQTRRPRVLVLSTHGFFHSAQAAPNDMNSMPGMLLPGAAIENPLLRSGLVLAGANRKADTNASSEVQAGDGILTGLEIVSTDLRGTELVVLSACETGLGDLRNGEGVAGLRQAFQLAGAEAVVATLWKIPDQETAWLMESFWQNLAAGQSKADALRNAQLLLLYHRDELRQAAVHGNSHAITSTMAQRGAGRTVPFDPNKAAHAPPAARTPRSLAPPLYWAAFTITGGDG